MYRLRLIFLLFLLAQAVIAEPIYELTSHKIGVKVFPNNDINYFFTNNKAELWRLVYGKFSKPPPDNPNYRFHCNDNEIAPDQALMFDLSEIIKNTGDSFNADNIHVYYDGEAGKKALALLLGEIRLKKSLVSITKGLIRKGDSEYAVLTPARLRKKLTLLNDNEENKMYVCFSYLQHLIATPVLSDLESNASLEVDPRKIVFWYEGTKANTVIPNKIATIPMTGKNKKR